MDSHVSFGARRDFDCYRCSSMSRALASSIFETNCCTSRSAIARRSSTSACTADVDSTWHCSHNRRWSRDPSFARRRSSRSETRTIGADLCSVLRARADSGRRCNPSCTLVAVTRGMMMMSSISRFGSTSSHHNEIDRERSARGVRVAK